MKSTEHSKEYIEKFNIGLVNTKFVQRFIAIVGYMPKIKFSYDIKSWNMKLEMLIVNVEKILSQVHKMGQLWIDVRSSRKKQLRL